MKINYFTPLPPLQTEVANHSAIVVRQLARISDLVVWTDQSAWTQIDGVVVRRFDVDSTPLAEVADARATFYNIGNNPLFHGGIYEFSRRFPGFLILHDTNLQNLHAGMAFRTSGTAEEYVGLMRRFYDADAELAAHRLLRGEADILQLMAHYPLTRAATQNASGIIVHNEAEYAAMQESDQTPVWCVPLSFDLAHLPRLRARRPRQPYRVIVFGHIGPNRRLREVLHALARSTVRSQYVLDIFGQVDDSEAVDATIRALGLDSQVIRHGFVPPQVLDRALRATDLAINLRLPSMGEASASQLRIWANAIPSLVTRTGWYSTLPDDTVAFVDPSREAEDLDAHLTAFAHDPAPYIRAGQRGRDLLRARHGSKAYAEALVRIAATSRDPSISRATGLVTAPKPGDPAPCTFVGNVDSFAPGEVTGWVRIPAEAETRLDVWLIMDGLPEATAEASLFRPDLMQAGHGDGCYGFVLRAPPERMAAARHLAVVAHTDNGEFVLHEVEQPASLAVPPAKIAADTAATASVHLDVTDLLHYAALAPNVSGIQRVQCGYIESLLREPSRRTQIRFSAFDSNTNGFYALATAEVSWLVRSLMAGSEGFAARRERAHSMLAPMGRQPLRAGPGHVLLVTGSFWSFPGFIDAIDRLRRESGIVYVQIFYDMVPVSVPETCPADQVQSFSRSIVRMVNSVDGVLAISQYSLGELRMFCSRLGLVCPPAAVVPLGGRLPARIEPEASRRAALPAGLNDFVLSVGTIEPRKNHLYLFHLWRRMLARRGQRTPTLVCAGRFGWLTDEFRRHLESSGNLDGHIVVLPEVSDAELRALYAACRFTIYPSLYEGWGLPVSESLVEGKLCVTSRVTAIPEAGGEWAHYLDPQNLEDGYNIVTRLLNDPELVRAAEREIRASYRPVSWDEATTGLWTGLDQVVQSRRVQPRPTSAVPLLPLPSRHVPPRIASPASPIAIARHELARIAFASVLDGADWHQVEEWGVWARGRIARLLFNCSDTASGHVLCYLRLSVPDYFDVRRCQVVFDGTSLAEVELSAKSRVIVVPVPAGQLVRLELILDECQISPPQGETRQLGIGLHRLGVCAADDVVTRLDFLEAELLVRTGAATSCAAGDE